MARYAADDLEALVQNRSFLFARSNGITVYPDFKFAAGGVLQGATHPNESSWHASDDCIEIKNADGLTTTWFDSIQFDGRGYKFLGRFGDKSGEHHHMLIENIANRHGFASVVDTTKQPHITDNKVAVLIRGHKNDEKINSLYSKLNKNRKGFDLYCIIDETHGKPSIDLPNIIWHSLGECQNLGLTQRRESLHWCGDFPFYIALRAHPEYQYYIMIEYDVEFSAQDASFMNDLVAKLQNEFSDVDMLGINYKHDTIGFWAPPCREVYGDSNSYYMTFPFIVLSKPLVAYLFSQRLLEAARGTSADMVINCEAFAVSAANAAGFRCADLNAVMPRSYNETMMMHSGPLGFGRPLGHKSPSASPVEIYHPIYCADEFVKRLRDRARIDQNHFKTLYPKIMAAATDAGIEEVHIKALMEIAHSIDP
jgi:hypothetical protein